MTANLQTVIPFVLCLATSTTSTCQEAVVLCYLNLVRLRTLLNVLAPSYDAVYCLDLRLVGYFLGNIGSILCCHSLRRSEVFITFTTFSLFTEQTNLVSEASFKGPLIDVSHESVHIRLRQLYTYPIGMSLLQIIKYTVLDHIANHLSSNIQLDFKDYSQAIGLILIRCQRFRTDANWISCFLNLVRF